MSQEMKRRQFLHIILTLPTENWTLPSAGNQKMNILNYIVAKRQTLHLIEPLFDWNHKDMQKESKSVSRESAETYQS